jgi:hypothetical protein
MTARKSGFRIGKTELPIVLGMVARNDRRHDIAAWFGVNQGRIKDAQDGRYGIVEPAPAEQLPPPGPPGIKGRRLRAWVNDALALLKKGDATGAAQALTTGAMEYDADEP